MGSRPARNAGRHVRAKFASCAQTPSRSAGPAPRGPQRGSRVGVGQRGRSEAQNLARRRAQLHPDKRDGGPARALSESCSDLARDTAQKPVVNLDLIHQQNAVVIGTQIVVQRAARTRHTSVTPPRQTATGKPWRERPYRTGRGATPRARRRGRSRHGLLINPDAVAQTRAA